MSELLASLARSIAGHWKRSLIVAFAVLAGLVVLAGSSTEPPADDFGVPGSESEQALALFKAHTPALAGVDATVVLETGSGRLTDPPAREAIGRTVERIAELPSVLTVSDPFAPGSPTVSPDRRIVPIIRLCSGLVSDDSSTSAIPSTPFSGVRISWLILARNIDFDRLASSARALAR